jgi:hypothetical protein
MPNLLGEAGQAGVFELDDASSRSKAATCRRTPKRPSAGMPPKGVTDGCETAFGLIYIEACLWLGKLYFHGRNESKPTE